MTNKKTLLTKFCVLLASLFVMSCHDIADDDHYKAPDWLKGNAWEVLAS